MSIHKNDPLTRLLARAAFAGSVTLSLASGFAFGHAGGGNATSSPPVPNVALSGLPLTFERNSGQASSDIRYLAHGRAYSIALTNRGATLSLNSGPAPSQQAPELIRLRLLGGSTAASPVGESPLPGRVNYLIGNDPSKWLTNVSTYGRVLYRGVYPGVDLVYYGTEGRLEYDFSVAPHADAQQVGLAFEGAQALYVNPRGALQIRTGEQEITFEKPRAYQVVSGQRHRVSAQYRIEGNVVRFRLGAYDRSQPLIIDPVLSYFSYLGGSSDDVIGITPPSISGMSGQAVAVDQAHDLYVVGFTQSTNFPTQAPVAAAPTKTSGTKWVFVTKFAPDAKSLVFSTYLGGTNGDDVGYGIALDATGNAFVVGQTGSTDFPTTSGAYLRICSPNYTNSPNNPYSGCGNNNGAESFITKLSPTGTLLASTFLGGSHTLSGATAVAVDSSGRPYVAGATLPGENIPAGTAGYNQAVGFPTTAGAIVAAYPFIANVPVNGTLQYDAYVSVFDPTLATLLYSTLLGDDRPQNGVVQFTAQANTQGTAVAVDASGNFYLAGYTADTYFPTTAGSVQAGASSCGALTAGTPNSLGGNCGFVAKFSGVGGANPPGLTYATYLGGQPAGANSSWADEITGIVADASGDAYVVGYANQAGFPTTSGAYQTTCNGFTGSNFGNVDCSAAFVSELNPAGSALIASTYFGCITCNGDAVATAGAIALDTSDNVYIAGYGGNSLPSVNGFSTNNGGSGSPFVAEFDSALTKLQFATLLNLGGTGQISPAGLALDTSGMYVAGNLNAPTSSVATSGAFQTGFGGGSSDGFVAKIIVTEATKTTLAISPTSATTGAAVTFTATVSETTGTAVPTGMVTFSNGSTTLGSGTLNSSGMATYSSSSLAAGSYSVTASYGGDATNNVSNSSAVSLTITTPPPPPPAPTATVSLSPSTITQGASATVTWSSTNATGCTASSAWSGAEATSGTMSVTPTTTGTLSYALACTGAGGTASASASLTVNAASSGGGGSGGGGSGGGSSSHGGGGAFDLWTVLALALIGFGRWCTRVQMYASRERA